MQQQEKDQVDILTSVGMFKAKDTLAPYHYPLHSDRLSPGSDYFDIVKRGP